MLEAVPNFLARGQNLGNIWAPGKAIMAFLWAFGAFLACVSAEVEFKHHNNTEMAAVLQQVHNRWFDVKNIFVTYFWKYGILGILFDEISTFLKDSMAFVYGCQTL